MDAYRYFNEIYGYKQSGWKIALKQGGNTFIYNSLYNFPKKKIT